MRCGVGIFAKTVSLSPVKTRLAADIGKVNAQAFYRLSVDCVEAFVSEAGEAFPEIIAPVWALAEETGPEHWRDSPFPAVWTGEGDLGTRLATISEYLFDSCNMVILIGTDSPHLSSGKIVEAMSLMMGARTECVAGPAADGGFYLFGSSRPIAREVWEGVTYSSSATLDELVGLLEAHELSPKMLSEEQDVDTVEDLKSLHQELAHRETLSGAQESLFAWLEENRNLF